MEKRRTFALYSKRLFITASLLSMLLLIGCSREDKAGTQARTDLTSEHFRGLYSGMVRNDVEDLIGIGDKSLAEHESLEVYSLSDGTTAVLRYRDDQLLGAYLRDKNNAETSIFDNTNMSGDNGVNNTDSSLTDGNTRDSEWQRNTDLDNAADAATEETRETTKK